MALTVLSLEPNAAALDVRILASDIDPRDRPFLDGERTVEVPPYRVDVTREADLAEDVEGDAHGVMPGKRLQPIQ